MKPLRGRKSLTGSSEKAPVRLDDNLFGTDTVEVIMAVSEGPCVGLVDGPSGFFIGDVPLVDPGSDTPNISNFELRVHKGVTPADTILPNLGGFGSSKNVGIDMRTGGQQVVASGNKTQIDYVDIRFTIGRLFTTDDKGNENTNTIVLRIEVKPRSSANWVVPFTNELPDTVTETSGASNYRPGAQKPGSYRNAAFHETYITNDVPQGSQVNPGAMWFNTATQYWRPAIRNADGVWVEPAYLTNSQIGSFIRWSWMDLAGVPRAAWYDMTGMQRSPEAAQVNANDFLLIPSAGQEVYNWNGVNWNDPTEQFTAPDQLGPGEFATSGVARSSVPREVRIPVARINEPYDIRVTRVSASETKTSFAQVTWESFQEISRDTFSFPGLALSHLTIKATDTFTSIPEFTQLWDGRVIRVPTNYDPVARTYAGFWDGTFKLAYSNNPGWVAYDLVMNAEYGKNKYYPEVLDPLACYEFAKHCDAHGFKMNELITDPRSINETINYIVGTAGGRYVDRGDGYSTILFDADDQPAVALFTPENVIDGLFTYSFTDITSRKNDYKISFVNPLIQWKEDRVRVYDQNSIDVQGSNPEEFIAVGCTDAEEAIKRGRLRLATALTEKTIVSFKTNRMGLYVQPFQIVLIGDPDAEEVITGRIKTVVTSTQLQLRDEIYIEPGMALTVSFFVGDGAGGFQSRQYALAGGVGKTSTLYLAQPLDITLPEKAVFSIGTPKAFRVTSIEEGDDPDSVSLTCIEINRLKWAFVDGLVELDDILAKQTGPLSRFTYAVTNLNAVGVTRADGSVSVILTWTPSPSMTGGYRVYSSYEGKQSEVVGEPGAPTFEIPNILRGQYVFSVVALSVDKTTESPPAAITFNLATGFRPVPSPLNLRLVDEPQAPIFLAKDPKFAWDASPDVLLDHYVFEVLDGTNQLIFTRSIPKDTLEFVFTLEMNKAARHGLPTRAFTVRLRAVDADGNFSQPSLLAVAHPPPVTPQPLLSHTPESLFIEYTRPPGDVIGVLAWVESESGFDPAHTTPKYDGEMTQIIIPVIANQKYFVRIALYDSYGKEGLNYSIELAYTVLFGFDVFDPGIPTGLKLTSETTKSGTGDVLTVIKAECDPSAGKNFATFEFEVKEQGGDWVRHTTSDFKEQFTGAVAGRTYTGRVRSVSYNLIASGWSPEVDVIAAWNMEPPGPTTGMFATAAFLTASVGWVNPVDKDLDYVEVWASDTADLVDATLVSKSVSNFFIDTFADPAKTKFYWTRPVNTSGVPATEFTGSVQATSAQVQYDQLKDGIIDATKFAQGLSAIGVVDTLPNPVGYDGPAYVTLTTDGLLYNIVNGQWVTGVDAVNLRGQIGVTQIADDSISTQKLQAYSIVAGKVAANAITSDTIAANSIITAKIAAGAVKADQVDASAITTDKLAANAVVAEKIATNAIIARTIATGAITADAIAADAVTANAIKANSISSTHIAAQAIQADRIALGTSGVGLNSWLSGGNNALLDGGKISANSIEASTLKIGGRGLTITGLDFSVNKTTRVVSWTAGGIGYIGDNGQASTWTIAAGSFSASSATTWFYWTKDTTTISATTDWATAISKSAGTAVLICTFDGFSGLNALYASTIIDGTRINTGTITATQIAASTIQAGNIAAGQIQAIHIGANQVTADKIGAGYITASGDIYLGSDRFRLSAPNQNLDIIDNNGRLRVRIGNLGNDFGLQLYGAQGAMIFGSGNGFGADQIPLTSVFGRGGLAGKDAINFLNGDGISGYIHPGNISTYIAAAAISEAYIANLSVSSAKIADLTVGTIKIMNGAISSTTAGTQYIGAGGQILLRMNCKGGSVQIQAAITKTEGSGLYITTTANYQYRGYILGINGGRVGEIGAVDVMIGAQGTYTGTQTVYSFFNLPAGCAGSVKWDVPPGTYDFTLYNPNPYDCVASLSVTELAK